MRPSRVIYERVALFAQKEAPWGRVNASISLSYSLHVSTAYANTLRRLAVPGDQVLGEFLIAHSSMLHGVGLGHSLLEKKLYCCTKELYDEKLCARPNTLIIDPSVATSPLLFYAAVNVSAYSNATKGLDATLEHVYTVNASGVYYLFIANCRLDPSITFALDGTSSWRNPFGFLNGEEWAELPLYWLLSVFYVGLLLFYGTRTAIHRPFVRTLHVAVLSLLGVGVLHALTAASSHTHYNETGEYSEAFIVLSAILSAILESGVRLVILLVALGFAIPRHRELITRTFLISISAMAVVYTISAAASDYFVYLELAGTPRDEMSKLMVDGALVLTNLAFFIWIGVRLVKMLSKLRDEHNGREHSRYLRLAIAMAGALSVSFALFIAQTWMEVNDLEDAAYKYWWMWEAYWEVVNAIAIAYVCITWHPSPNDEFAYSRQLQGTEDDSDSEDNAELVSMALREADDHVDLDDD